MKADKNGWIEPTTEVMNEVIAEEAVEQIARMDQDQRDLFIYNLVSKWPELASQLNMAVELYARIKDKENNDVN
jgi:hypothetical protein